ncbi:hypothetical protein QR685DRAFT_449039 [Neurospora intermedia]|uniref:Uncharacterized protein n=1 Tax=Neurospora intermedia TaxID=5142 RepID=A0ABR3D4Z5_NEUIN
MCVRVGALNFSHRFGPKFSFLYGNCSWICLACLSVRASKFPPHSYFMGSRGNLVYL